MSTTSEYSAQLAQVTELAERALLGALLWEPRRLTDVQWLRAEDFHRPAYGAIYATLRGMARDRKPIDLAALPQVMTAAHGVYHDIQAGQYGPLSGPALADLLRDTPADDLASSGTTARAADSAEHRRYAQLVLEASIRRQVVAMGARIEQVATQDQRATPAASAELEVYVTRLDTPRLVETLTRQLDRAATRLGELADQLTRATDPGDPTVTAGGGPRDIPALVAAHPRRYPAPAAEQVLIGACLTVPWLRELATSRLIGDDLTHQANAATWTSLRAMTQAGQPVDYVLLAARQVRDHADVRAPDRAAPLRPVELARLAQRSNVAAGCHALGEVTHTALLRAADRTQRILATLARDPALDSGRLVDTTRQVLHQLRGDLTRLDDRARADTPAPTPAAAGGERATTRGPKAYSGAAGTVRNRVGGVAQPLPPPRAPLTPVRPGPPGPGVSPGSPRRSR